MTFTAKGQFGRLNTHQPDTGFIFQDNCVAVNNPYHPLRGGLFKLCLLGLRRRYNKKQSQY